MINWARAIRLLRIDAVPTPRRAQMLLMPVNEQHVGRSPVGRETLQVDKTRRQDNLRELFPARHACTCRTSMCVYVVARRGLIFVSIWALHALHAEYILNMYVADRIRARFHCDACARGTK